MVEKMSFALITTEPKSDTAIINHKVLLVLEYQEEAALNGLAFLGLFARFTGGSQYIDDAVLTSKNIKALAHFPKIFLYNKSSNQKKCELQITYDNHEVKKTTKDVGSWPIHAQAISNLNQTSELKEGSTQLPILKSVYNLFSKYFKESLKDGQAQHQAALTEMEKSIRLIPHNVNHEIGLFFFEILEIFRSKTPEQYSPQLESRLLKSIQYFKENPQTHICNHCGKVFKNKPYTNKLKSLFDASQVDKKFHFCSESCFVEKLIENPRMQHLIELDQFVPEGTIEAFSQVLAEFNVSKEHIKRLAGSFRENSEGFPY